MTMIQHTFSAEGFEHTDKLQKYVDQKAKDIEKYVPRLAREATEMSIRITRAPKTKAEMYTCHIELKLPKQKLVATEKVEHSYAALDVTMAEIRRQLADYKSKHGKQTLRHRASRALRGRFAKSEDTTSLEVFPSED